MTHVATAEPRHCRLIAGMMRPRDVEEVRAGWQLEPNQAMEEALASSYFARTLFQGFEPLLMYGLAPLTVLGGTARIWLFGTRAIDRHPIAFARACKRWLPEIFNHCALATNFIDLGDSQALKWMHWLGGTCALLPCERGGRLFAQFFLVDPKSEEAKCRQA